MASKRTPLAALFCPGLLVAALLFPAAAQSGQVTFQNGTASCSQTNINGTFPVDQAVDGVVDNSSGWAIYCNGTAALPQTAVFETSSDLLGPSLLTFVFRQQFAGPNHTLGRFRLSATFAQRPDFADGLDNGGDLGDGSIWTVLDPTSAVSTGGATLTEQGDNSILASGTNPSTDTYTVTATTNLPTITGIRLELLEDASLPFSGPGRETQTGNFVLSELELTSCAFDELDIDDDDDITPLTDALLLLRYVFGFRQTTLVTGATGGQCDRCQASAIEGYIAAIQGDLDVDDDGAVGPLTDALLILRYAFGFRGATLIGGAVDPDCERCTAPEIEAYLACLFA